MLSYRTKIGIAAAAVLYAALHIPVLIEIKNDLYQLREDLKIAEQRVMKIGDGLFFIAANAPSISQRETTQDLENILGRKSPYTPSQEEYHIELTITPPQQ